jgi:hypothetical protein
VGNGPGIPELLTVKDQPKENNQFYRTDVALSKKINDIFFDNNPAVGNLH